MKKIEIRENGLNLVFYLSKDGKVALRYCGRGECSLPELTEKEMDKFLPVVIATSERGFATHHGAKKICGASSCALRYTDILEEKLETGKLVKLFLESDELKVVCWYEFLTKNSRTVLRTKTEVMAKREISLEYVSAFYFTGFFSPFDEEMYEHVQAYIPHNTWHGEGQWRKSTLADLGLTDCHAGGMNLKRITYGNTGSWSSKEYLPAGILESNNEFIFWQIETNGSWQAEIGQNAIFPYIALSGPTFHENGWQKRLRVNEWFCSPSVTLAFEHSLNDCIASLTEYRRQVAIVYPADADALSQYNGYMHANWDNPSTTALLEQMQACKKVGIETFVCDAGWFSQGEFWTVLGDWLHPNEPFEGKSFKELMDICREMGMKPGLWLELEDIGIDCPIVAEVEHLLMRRNGVKVCDNRRYFFDFSLPETCAYMDNVVDTVVERYGVEYIKLDYNCDLGVGCDNENGGFGEGLLAHNLAFVDWIKAWRERMPELVIEGCASGGMRLDHKTLSIFALGNTSDQVYYNRTPYIICNLASYLLPERMGVWAYPIQGETDEQVNLNLVNGVLFRMQLSGEVHRLNERQQELVADGVNFYNSLKDFKKVATPYLPMGFCKFFDKTVAFGLKDDKKLLLAVYNLNGNKEKRIPLPAINATSVERAFPFRSTATARLEEGLLCISFNFEEEGAIFALTLA